MSRALQFQTWLDPLQGEGSKRALSVLASPSEGQPGEVIGYCLDVDLNEKGRWAQLPRQWFCLANERGFNLASFDSLPEEQKSRAALAACYLLDDAAFEQWIEERLGWHMKKHGRNEAGYGIFVISGAVLAVHEDALSTLGLDLENLCGESLSKEVVGAISQDLSHHARLEALHQLDVLFGHYHMNETTPGDRLSVFLGDLRVLPGPPIRRK